jgi:hypothetical protein
MLLVGPGRREAAVRRVLAAPAGFSPGPRVTPAGLETHRADSYDAAVVDLGADGTRLAGLRAPSNAPPSVSRAHAA